MDNFFEIAITYNGKGYLFPASLITYSYSYNIEVNIWINPHGASSEKIIEQVKKCPSGALSFFYNNEK